MQEQNKDQEKKPEINVKEHEATSVSSDAVVEEVKVEEKKKPDFPFRDFLENKKVRVVPIVREEAWTMLTDKPRDESYMFPKAKRSYTVPVSQATGQLKEILDNNQSKKYYTPQYPKQAFTEQEFFEAILDRKLSIHLRKENFWKPTKHDSFTRVELAKEGVLLNISNPKGYIHEKILKANNERIAPSWEQRNDRASYEFALVDEEIVATNKAEKRKLKDEAFEYYMTIKDSPIKLGNFLKLSGKSVLNTEKLEFLRTEVAELRDNNPRDFLRIGMDDNFSIKVMLIDAVRCGALLRDGKTGYKLPNGYHVAEGEQEAIAYFLDPERRPIREKVKVQIENSKK